MRIELEYNAREDGRPEGHVRRDGDAEARPFTGTIELLRLLEDLVDTAAAAPR